MIYQKPASTAHSTLESSFNNGLEGLKVDLQRADSSFNKYAYAHPLAQFKCRDNKNTHLSQIQFTFFNQKILQVINRFLNHRYGQPFSLDSLPDDQATHEKDPDQVACHTRNYQNQGHRKDYHPEKHIDG